MLNIGAEADKYFERNGKGQEDFAGDYFQDYLARLVKPEARVLEIGCSSGYRLAALAVNGAMCYGIDPSAEAIAHGKKSYPAVDLSVGYAHRLPYPEYHFDVVYIPTVFYTIPREHLLTSISEIDRVLKKGGLLVIDDFFPEKPCRRENHHAPGTYIYKQHYWKLFLESGWYVVQEELPHRIGEDHFDTTLSAGDDMCITVTLEKSREDTYPICPSV